MRSSDKSFHEIVTFFNEIIFCKNNKNYSFSEQNALFYFIQ